MRQPELFLFAKAPIAGTVKTRLQPRYSATRSARIARLLIRATARLAAHNWPGVVTLCASPDASHPLFRELAARYGFHLARQDEGDLGRRMAVALGEGIARAGAAAVMGCDVPQCDWEILDEANEQVARGRYVVGPTVDGGYYFIGMPRVHAELFEGIEWGGANVLEATLARAARLGIEFDLLPELRDIDSADDLRAVARIFAPLRRYR
jgi:rSAM/selenodomain-associated transferase 1